RHPVRHRGGAQGDRGARRDGDLKRRRKGGGIMPRSADLRAALCALAVVLSLPITLLARGPQRYLTRPASWFATAEARRTAARIPPYQADRGGWPKNIDTTAGPYTGDRKKLKGTFDNGATTDELRFLARIHTATKEKRYLAAFEKGLAHILE